jgi:hypothetical protein
VSFGMDDVGLMLKLKLGRIFRVLPIQSRPPPP